MAGKGVKALFGLLVVKEAVHIAFQDPLRDRFKELPEADMKEILHQWMFESGSYKSLPEHVALYEVLEASMKRANRDDFLAEKDKSRKRRQDHPPPLYYDLNKKKRHDHDASGSIQPLAPQSSAWKSSDTRESLFSSSKQQPAPHKNDALSISKLKATNYPDFGLEELVPSLWIQSERNYNIKLVWAFRTAYKTPIEAGDHRKVQINELNELRDQAYENSLIYKEKSKRLHDSKIKNRVFNIGE
uniref:Reverse transcriptase domain-containing protein n=1 Tax=Tanacetum cinerariifolium TaxID=118510 RepID=A0A699J008_TANCI|nr:hypothetical protein [Tanacetum cinerariifolium]